MSMRFESDEEWQAEAIRRFGPNSDDWRFVCPVCGYEAAVKDWLEKGAVDSVAFSCIGRWIPGSRDALTKKGAGPCNYAGGGLFKLNPVIIEGRTDHYFAFAEAPKVKPA